MYTSDLSSSLLALYLVYFVFLFVTGLVCFTLGKSSFFQNLKQRFQFTFPSLKWLQASFGLVLLSLNEVRAAWSYVIHATFRQAQPNLVQIESIQFQHHLMDLDEQMAMHIKLVQIKLSYSLGQKKLQITQDQTAEVSLGGQARNFGNGRNFFPMKLIPLTYFVPGTEPHFLSSAGCATALV